MRSSVALTGVLACACGSPDAIPDAPSPDAPSGELCNGIDDTNDGRVDESCPCAAFDIEMPGTVLKPGIVWTGTRHLVVVSDDGTLRVMQLTDGAPGLVFNVGSVPPHSAPNTHAYDMAWSGSTLAVVHITPTSTFELVFIDETGALLQKHLLPNTNARWSTVAWTGDRFLVVGDALAPQGIAYSEFEHDGSPITATLIVEPPPPFSNVNSVVATATKYIVGAQFYQDARVIVIDRATQTAENYALDLDRSFDYVTVARSGSGLAAAKASGGSGAGDSFQPLDTNGVPKPAGALPWGSATMTLEATATGYAAFAVIYDAPPTNFYASLRLDHDGQPLEPPALPLATFDAAGFMRLDAVTTEAGFALAHSYAGNSVRVIQVCY